MEQAGVPTLIRLYRHRWKLRVWVRSRLWAQVVGAMLLGIATGTLLGPATGWLSATQAEIVGAWLAMPGQIFLGLIAIVLVPLVFASIVGGLTGAGSNEALRKVGLRLAGFILVTTTGAAAIGIALSQYLRPGEGLDIGTPAPPPPGETDPLFDLARIPEIITGVLPANPAASVTQGDLLAVVVLALLVGIAALQVDRTRIAPFLALLDALLSISMTIVKWAMMLAPIAVFGLMAQLMMRVGLDSVLGLLSYVLTVLLGLAVLFAAYLLLLLIAGRVGPARFLRSAGETLLLAFSTSSSSAVMPSTIQSARRLGVPEGTANLVVPLGATMNMAGTALYQSVAIIFLAQIAGVELGTGQIAVVVATLVASSIGAPGTPGVSIAILVSVAAGFGIPAGGLVLIMGVDRLLDMSRTTVNVTGDLTASVLLRNVRASAPSDGKAGAT